MRTFEAGGVPHRTRPLCAYEQFHLLKTLSPVMPALLALDIGAATLDAELIAGALQGVTPAEITRAFDAAVAAVERDLDGVWQSATKSALPLSDMMTMVLAVVDINFAAYLSRKKPDFRPAMGRRQEFEPVGMPDDEMWLFRPCVSTPPLIPDALALFDGRLTIYHVAKFNDVLDVQAENDHRAFKAAQQTP